MLSEMAIYGRVFAAVVICIVFTTSVTRSCPYSNGEVVMSYNNLQNVTNSTFEVCKEFIVNITKVNLSNNEIVFVHPDSFKSLYNLKEMDLSYNAIQDLDLATFQGMRTLETLDLSYNKFQTLRAGLLNHELFRLTTVSFMANNISEVEWGFVNEKHENLKNINLKNNSLTTFDPWPYLIKYTGNSTRKDRVFDLQYNKVSSITNRFNWTFDLMFPYEVEIKLMFNELDTISTETLRQFKPDLEDQDGMSFFLTFYMNISNNPFFCDCRLYPFAKSLRDSFLRWRDVDKYRLRCAAPAEVVNEDWLHDIPYHYFICNTTTDCPANCFCQARPHNNTFLIDCRGAGLTELPDIIPDVRGYNLELFFDDNMITDVKNVTYIGQVYNMSLKNNQITQLKSETVRSMTGIKKLDIRHNRIEYLPKDINRLGYGTVKLNGNPLKCGCDSLWMSDWFNLDQENGDLSVECQDEDGDYHRIIDLNLSALGCTNDYIIIVSVIGAVVAGLVVAALVFAKRCPYETKVILYRLFRIHPRDIYKPDTDEKFAKDIYISFDEEDVDVRKWIMNIFIEKLNHKKPFYRIMIPFIHFVAGPKYDQIDEWICKCKRVVIILSERFFENENCEVEAMCAAKEQHEKPDSSAKIIYVLFNKRTIDLIKDKIEEEPWKTRLSGKILMSPDDRLFWSKLRYELPIKVPNHNEIIMPRKKRPDGPQEVLNDLRNRNPRNQRELQNGRSRNINSELENDDRKNKYPKRSQLKNFPVDHGPPQDRLQIQNETATRPKAQYPENNINRTPLKTVIRPGVTHLASSSNQSEFNEIEVLELPDQNSTRQHTKSFGRDISLGDIFGSFK